MSGLARLGTTRVAGLAALALTSAAIAVTVPALPSSSQVEDPPGNNGTIKVDGIELDVHPDNEPHPGCTFQIDFYGYDAGVGDATVTFELQAPTVDGRTLEVVSGDLTPDIGEDAAGGGTDLDAEETYTLAFTGDPHPQQGYHVRLTVSAPGSIGEDDKHKVFWVGPCEDQVPATTESTTTTTEGTGVAAGGADRPADGVADASVDLPAATPAAAVQTEAAFTG